MIKHIVFWRLKDSAHGNDKATNARLIKAKRDLIGLLTEQKLRIIDHAVNRSFNCITVDGDTSTNDSLIVIASNKAKHPIVDTLNSGPGLLLKRAMMQRDPALLISKTHQERIRVDRIAKQLNGHL